MRECTKRAQVLATLVIIVLWTPLEWGCSTSDDNSDDDTAGDDDSGDDDTGDDDLSDDDGDWIQISAGRGISCGVLTGGAGICWGSSEVGASEPTAGVLFTEIVAGQYHSCGLTDTGIVTCWGIDDGSALDHGQVTEVPSGQFVDIDVDWYEHATCAVRVDGAIVCWGTLEGEFMQGDFQQVSVHVHQICGLHTDGTVECTGSNAAGQLDVPGGEFEKVVAGDFHSCGLRDDGSVECWGCQGVHNDFGQCDVPVGEVFVDIGALGGSYGITATHELLCWPSSTVCDSKQGLFSQVSRGSHMCGVTPGGGAVCWGCDPEWEVGECDPPQS